MKKKARSSQPTRLNPPSVSSSASRSNSAATSRSGFGWSNWFSWEVLAVVCLFILSLAVRLYHLDELMTFTYDQGRDMYVLQQISRGDFTLIGPTTGLPGVFLGPFMYYFLLPGFILSNGSPSMVLKWQLLVIALSLPLFYLILRPLVGKGWALIGYLMLVLNSGAIEQARQIWNPSLVVPTLLVTTWALFNSPRKPWLLPISLLAFGLSLQTELAYTFFMAPAIGAWIFYYSPLWPLTMSLVSKLRGSTPLLAPKPGYSWPVLVIAVAAFALTLLPQALFEVRNQFLITNSIRREMQDTSKKVPLAKVWAERPAVMMAELKKTLAHQVPGSTVLVISLFAGSVYFLTRRQAHPEKLFLVGYLWIPLLAMMMHTGNYGNFFDYYITAHYLPMLAMLVLLLAQLPFQTLIKAAALLFSAAVFIHFSPNYTLGVFRYTTAYQIEALQYARQHRQTQKAALEVFVPNLVPVGYQYLSEWLSRTGQADPMDFGVQDHQEFFLIYEPAISDGSRVAFEQWYPRWKTQGECDLKAEFGITTVERCKRKTNPQSL